MFGWVRRGSRRAYERVLNREIDDGPTHVAIIQDGNRRYARKNGDDAPDGHKAGAQTTEDVLTWCEELGIEELMLYTFSTKNFDRPEREYGPLFDLTEDKLYELVDSERVYNREVAARAIGEAHLSPDRVRNAIEYAESRAADYDGFTLNIALAYGGRAELLGAARDVRRAVKCGNLSPDEVDVSAADRRLPGKSVRDVDLIIRPGGDERISNFLSWHANGSEAAVYFCASYWPEFSKVDFLRGIRTYESREQSRQRTWTERAVTLARAVAEVELEDARTVVGRLCEQLPSSGADEVSVESAKRTDETVDWVDRPNCFHGYSSPCAAPASTARP